LRLKRGGQRLQFIHGEFPAKIADHRPGAFVRRRHPFRRRSDRVRRRSVSEGLLGGRPDGFCKSSLGVILRDHPVRGTDKDAADEKSRREETAPDASERETSAESSFVCVHGRGRQGKRRVDDRN
jgi:hypothetical protein